ncbi:hypothetical protein JCM10207_003134 [Rhodosporidiobolus poonsookiae]
MPPSPALLSPLEKRLAQLEERADDGFWTPGMGEPGFETASPVNAQQATLDSPSTGAAEQPSVILVTVTATVEVAASTFTQLVQPVPSTSSAPTILLNPKQAAAPASSSGRLFDVSSPATPGKVVQLSTDSLSAAATDSSLPASSSGPVFDVSSAGTPGKVVQLSTEAPSPAEPSSAALLTTTLQRQEEPLFTLDDASTAATPTTSSERVFSPTTRSVIRALAPSSSAAVEEAASETSDAAAPVQPASSSTTAPAIGSSRIAVVAPSSPTTTNAPAASNTLSSLLSSTSSLAIVVLPASSSLATLFSASSPSSTFDSPSSIASGASSSSSPTSSTLSSLSSTPSSSSTSSTASTPRTTAESSSFFSKLGSSPANIALTTIVCAGILAVLLGVLAFFLRRCHRRRKRALIGDLLGSEGGDSPRDEWKSSGGQWDEKYAEFSPLAAGPRSGVSAESPGIEPEEVWRRRQSSTHGHGHGYVDYAASHGAGTLGMLGVPVAREEEQRRASAVTASDWTSIVGDGVFSEAHGPLEAVREVEHDRRESESTIGTAILYPSRPTSQAHPSFHLPNRMLVAQSQPQPVQAYPHPARPPLVSTAHVKRHSGQASFDSQSVYSETVPPTPLTPFAPVYTRPSFYSYRSAIPLSPALASPGGTRQLAPATYSPRSPRSTRSPGLVPYSPRSARSPPLASAPLPTLGERETLVHPAAGSAPAVTRTHPSLSGPGGATPASPSGGGWKESLERVMGTAAEMMGANFLGRTSGIAPSDVEKGAPSGGGGDRFTALPETSSPRRQPSIDYFTFPGPGASRSSPPRASPPRARPAPLSLASPASPANAHRTSFASSSSTSLPGEDDLVTPTTLAFPERALAQVQAHGHAARGVRTQLSSASLARHDRAHSAELPSTSRFEPLPFALRPPPPRTSAHSYQQQRDEPVNSFVPARPPRSTARRPSLPLAFPPPSPSPSLGPSAPPMTRHRSSSLTSTPSHRRSRSNSFESIRTGLLQPHWRALGREMVRSGSLSTVPASSVTDEGAFARTEEDDAGTTVEGEVSDPFADRDGGSESLELSSTSSCDDSHDDASQRARRGTPAPSVRPRRRPTSAQDKRVSSLVLERRRRSLAAASGSDRDSVRRGSLVEEAMRSGEEDMARLREAREAVDWAAFADSRV